MQYIKDYILEIVGFVLISGFLINILPDGKNTKYIKLFTGLITTILLLSPILKIMSADTDIIFKSDITNEASVRELKNNLDKKIYEESQKACEEYVKKHADDNIIVEKVNFNDGELKIYIREDKRINIGKIVIGEMSESDRYEYLAEKISNETGIDRESVHIYETG